MNEINIAAEDEGARLDVFLAGTMEQSRSHIQRHIGAGHIRVNLSYVPKRYIVKAGDIITCAIPPPEIYEAKPEDIPLDIVYEDVDVIVVNKPQNMVVHPAPGHFSGTLVNALLYHCRDLSGVNGVLRPGIVHRLDKDTSGLLVVAKHDRAHHGLAAQLAKRTMGRIYQALTRGIIQQDRIVISNIIGRHPVDRKKMAVLPGGNTGTSGGVKISGGREAITHITVLERFKKHTLVEARLETGRTHQIRVHLSHLGHPVLNDPVYGPDTKAAGQLLHAKTIYFDHPISGKKMHFNTELPVHFKEVLKCLA